MADITTVKQLLLALAQEQLSQSEALVQMIQIYPAFVDLWGGILSCVQNQMYLPDSLTEQLVEFLKLMLEGLPPKDEVPGQLAGAVAQLLNELMTTTLKHQYVKRRFHPPFYRKKYEISLFTGAHLCPQMQRIFFVFNEITPPDDSRAQWVQTEIKEFFSFGLGPVVYTATDGKEYEFETFEYHDHSMWGILKRDSR